MMDRATIPSDIVIAEGLPYDRGEPNAEAQDEIRLPRDLEGQINGRLAKVSWRYRMRWIDDGGR